MGSGRIPQFNEQASDVGRGGRYTTFYLVLNEIDSPRHELTEWRATPIHGWKTALK